MFYEKGSYRSETYLNKRKSLFENTHPYFNIEDQVLKTEPAEDGQSILDVGCGTGILLLKTAELLPNSSLIGLDISSDTFENAKKQAKNHNLNLSFVVGDVQCLPFPDKSFNRVTAIHMLYHASNIHQAIQELKRVTKPDGKVLISANSKKSRPIFRHLKTEIARMFNRNDFPDSGFKFNFEDAIAMVKSYFDNISFTEYASVLSLTNPQPYVDYFDSDRDFWQPSFSDEEWSKVLNFIKNYISAEIEENGSFKEISTVGIIVATLPKH